jgi:hypothetical protein
MLTKVPGALQIITEVVGPPRGTFRVHGLQAEAEPDKGLGRDPRDRESGSRSRFQFRNFYGAFIQHIAP